MPTSNKPSNGCRVLLLENIHASARELFEKAGFEVESVAHALKPEELKQRVGAFDVLGIRSKTHITDDILSAAGRLLTLGCFCIGTNQVELDAANRRGVAVFNAPFSNTRSVAELVICEVIALARQIGDRVAEMHKGDWKKVSAGCFEVRGKTLGIVGYGHIGSQVGVLAEAIGMRVLFFDIQTKLPMGNNHAMASLDELLEHSDFVTLHVPETPQTAMMIGARELATIKQGAYLLNLSRGSVVDIAALSAAIRSKHVSGAAIDVFPQEPASNTEPFCSELQQLPNVILTPHVGGSTVEAQGAIGREVATSLIKFIKSGASTGAVNFPNVELPQIAGTHRVLNVHRNQPGVLRDINRIVSDLEANIHSQVLATDANIGYLIMDLDQDVSASVSGAVGGLRTNIRTRVAQ